MSGELKIAKGTMFFILNFLEIPMLLNNFLSKFLSKRTFSDNIKKESNHFRRNVIEESNHFRRNIIDEIKPLQTLYHRRIKPL